MHEAGRAAMMCLVRMSPFPRKLIGAILGLVLAVAPLAASACDVPVFRYALEFWDPDAYVAVVFQRGPLALEQQALLDSLAKPTPDGFANVVVRKVDVARDMPAPFRSLWEAQSNPTLPWTVLRYPARSGIEASVWAGPLSADTVKGLVDSPVRRRLGRCLLQGQTAVWLLLDSGNKAQDDGLEAMLTAESRKLEATLQLPTPSPDDPPLNAQLPLKIAFSVLRVARSDPAEQFLVRQLLNWDPQLAALRKPMLFPIFGRGRALPPAVGETIKPAVLEKMARLMTGPCSCQIKEMNAGYDLLMRASWDSLAQREGSREADQPPLVSLTSVAELTSHHPGVQAVSPRPEASRADPPGKQPGPARTAAGPSARARPPDHLARNLAAVLGLGVGLVGVGTWMMRTKPRRTSPMRTEA